MRARPGDRRRRLARSRGQALTELALTLPLCATLTLGVADGGRAFYYREAVTNAARQALRAAASDVVDVQSPARAQPVAGTAACLGTSGTTTSSKTVHVPFDAVHDAAYMQPIADAAALESTSSGSPSGSTLSATSTTVTVTWHCLNGSPVTNAGATSHDPAQGAAVAVDSIEVQVSYKFALITPLVSRLFGGATTTIGSDVVGRAEY